MLPVLYSFRRCPYAMRARLALRYSGVGLELREVDLNAIPEQLSLISSDNTVPVLHLPDGSVIDESWDIAKWAIEQRDDNNWAGIDNAYLNDAEMLVELNDYSFKDDLDHYKYADRYPEHPMQHYRELAEEYLQELEERLSESRYLSADSLSVTDFAVFPFIRQFILVDEDWFDNAPYPKLQRWFHEILESELFESIMTKYPLWKEGDEPVVF